MLLIIEKLITQLELFDPSYMGTTLKWKNSDLDGRRVFGRGTQYKYFWRVLAADMQLLP